MTGAGTVHQLSFAPLFVQAVVLGRGDNPKERTFPASAFLVGNPHDLILVTARHVLAGEDLHGSPLLASGARPDVLRVHLHDAMAGDVKARKVVEIPLWTDESWNEPLFQSHPAGPAVDVSAIRLGYEPGPELVVPFDPWKTVTIGDLWNPVYGEPPKSDEDEEDIPLRPLDRVSILGFPFGDEGTWPTGIWVTGFVASEPLVPYKGGPAFLLDARTREGLSGAPVVRYLRPGDPVTSFGGTVHEHEMHLVELLGVYSGRLDPASDLGRCVTVEAVREVLALLPEATFFEDSDGEPDL